MIIRIENIKENGISRDEVKSRCHTCLGRRKFLKSGLNFFSVAALSAPTFSFLTACSQQPLSSGGPAAGTQLAIPNSSDNLYTFNFSDYPQLKNPGGSIRVVVNATSGEKPLFITRASENSVDTVSTICTHQGCTLNDYNASIQQYSCPCHGSIFNVDGSIAQGPATTPLANYAGTISGTGVQITIP